MVIDWAILAQELLYHLYKKTREDNFPKHLSDSMVLSYPPKRCRDVLNIRGVFLMKKNVNKGAIEHLNLLESRAIRGGSAHVLKNNNILDSKNLPRRLSDEEMMR